MRPLTQNGYNYGNSNPILNSDPSGLWTVDFGASFAIHGAGVTSGILISDKGIYSYAGYGVSTPGPGVSLTFSQNDPEVGTYVQTGGGFIYGGTATISSNGISKSRGLVTPGLSSMNITTIPAICF